MKFQTEIHYAAEFMRGWHCNSECFCSGADGHPEVCVRLMRALGHFVCGRCGHVRFYRE